MTRQASFPTPVGPFGLETPAGSTDALHPVGAELELDALPLLEQRLHARLIAPEHAHRGAYLALHDGDRARLLALEQDITHLGRGSHADLRFEDCGVSRDHAILIRQSRHFRILDNRSANGTYVNGRQTMASNLSDGDVIELGPVRLQFVEIG